MYHEPKGMDVKPLGKNPIDILSCWHDISPFSGNLLSTKYLTMKIKLIAAVSLISVVSFLACKKENQQTKLSVHMTDFPGDWEEVNIDLKQINVKFDSDTMHWQTMQTNAGIYNLLDLQNGVDTLLAEGTFPSSFVVKEIRLIVGSENSIKTNGQTYPLTIPSGAETGLKIKVNKKLEGTLENILIDFNALLSVNEETDGFKLRPVIVLK